MLAVLIPLASVLTYLQLGNPEAAAPGAATAPADRHSVTPEQIQKMVTALGERLRAQPDDAEGWLMLGRSYTALSRYRDAATAFRVVSDPYVTDDAGTGEAVLASALAAGHGEVERLERGTVAVVLHQAMGAEGGGHAELLCCAV